MEPMGSPSAPSRGDHQPPPEQVLRRWGPCQWEATCVTNCCFNQQLCGMKYKVNRRGTKWPVWNKVTKWTDREQSDLCGTVTKWMDGEQSDLCGTESQSEQTGNKVTCVEQSHKDSVWKAAVEEQLSSKTIQPVWEPISEGQSVFMLRWPWLLESYCGVVTSLLTKTPCFFACRMMGLTTAAVPMAPRPQWTPTALQAPTTQSTLAATPVPPSTTFTTTTPTTPSLARHPERSVISVMGRLQALVYGILPSTTAVFSYAIGSRKLS